jgi:AGCS family alanine or glycine:cation symporter
MMGMYALMAIPTMLSALILAPKVMAAAREYFEGLEK